MDGRSAWWQKIFRIMRRKALTSMQQPVDQQQTNRKSTRTPFIVYRWESGAGDILERALK